MSVELKRTLISPAFTVRNKISRLLWLFCYFSLFRFSPIPLFKFRACILNLFGAELSYSARIYPDARIWLPSNLRMGELSTIGRGVNVYNQGFIHIGKRVIISQSAHLCASTHDYNDPLHPLILAPITIHDDAWICAEAFVGPGVHVAKGAVLGARACSFKALDEWSVYGGNPARYIKPRNFGSSANE